MLKSRDAAIKDNERRFKQAIFEMFFIEFKDCFRLSKNFKINIFITNLKIHDLEKE